MLIDLLGWVMVDGGHIGRLNIWLWILLKNVHGISISNQIQTRAHTVDYEKKKKLQ